MKFGSKPRNDIDAERSVIGSIFLKPEALFEVSDFLQPTDFDYGVHQAVYAAMLDLALTGQPIDPLTVKDKISSEHSTSAAYLTACVEHVTTASHVKQYAEIVKRHAVIRSLALACKEGLELCDGDLDPGELAAQVAARVAQATEVAAPAVDRGMPELTSAFVQHLEAVKAGKRLTGLRTGLTDLDRKLAGLHDSDLVILAARPSVGKSALALDVARNVARREQVPVVVFSLEMSAESLTARLVAAEANVDLWKVRTGELTDADIARLSEAADRIKDLPILIQDASAATITDVRTRSRRALRGRKGLIVVDYLQLMDAPAQRGREQNRVQEVSKITRGLKALARELDVPVLALSQLSRAVEDGGPAIPKLSHLRESGSIEQDADVVVFIYRKAADRHFKPEQVLPEEQHVAELHVAKHRNGPVGVVKVQFDEATTSFRDLGSAAPSAPLPPRQFAKPKLG